MAKDTSQKIGYINLTEALEIAKQYNVEVTRPTILKWCIENNCARQFGGIHSPWYIDEKKFKDFLSNG